MEITPGDQRCKPLTKKEIKWLERFEAVMAACPSKRLECYTIGDNDLQFFDANLYDAEDKGDITDSRDVGQVLIDSGSFRVSIFGPFRIVGACG